MTQVTDIKGQSSTDEVNVYVKPAINMPPTAEAGDDKVIATHITLRAELTFCSFQEISLPQNWAILDGTKSHDDIEITWSEWQQLEGPNTAKIVDAGKLKANATELTKGKYR